MRIQTGVEMLWKPWDQLTHQDKLIPILFEQKQMGKPRQLRIQVTGGSSDVKLLMKQVKDSMDSTFNQIKWILSFEEIQRFGNYGPLHKGTIGFKEKT